MGLNLAVLRPDRLDTKVPKQFGLTRVGLTMAGSFSGPFRF